MTVNDDLLSGMVGHQIGLLRLSTGIAHRIVEILDAVDDDLLSRIERTGRDGSWTIQRLNGLLRDIRVINRDVYGLVQKELTAELRALADYEASYQLELMDDVLPIRLAWRSPTRAALMSVVTEEPLQGGLLREWVAGMESGRYGRLRDALRIGFVEGETVGQIVRRVRGTRSASFRDGVLEISRRSATSMVRTAVNHVATAAREVLYDENPELVKGVEWVSTLDLRTTAVCRARDGRVYPVGSGPRPPAHVACRSTTSPVVRSWSELGLDLKEAPEGTRASMSGQVAADLTYGAWLRKQSRASQDEVLGPTRAELWRAGELDMDSFVDATGRSYTLDELRRRERGAWRRAGLEEAA